MANRPLTDADRKAVRRLHAAGKTRNDIAREIGRSPSTVTKLAGELGLSFDRTATEAATQARTADLAARRTVLAEALQADAEKLRVQLWQPCVYGEFGGKENVWSQVNLDLPRFGDQRQILASVQTAVNTSAKLVPPADGGTDVDDAVSMLTNLAAGIRRIAEQEADSGE